MWNISRHREVMFDVIREIYASPAGIYLGFKGGTMAYFFYSLDRFSVDLDFDLLKIKKIGVIRESIREILLKHGRIKDDSDKRMTVFFLLNYETGQRNIKVEISKRVLKSMKYKVVNFYGTDVRIVAEEESCASKLLACLTRKRLAARDFYDAYFYFKKGVKPSEAVIKEAVNKSLSDFYKDLMVYVEKNLNNKVILHGLGELVDERQKIWIKNNLKKELLSMLEFRIDEIRRLKGKI